MITHMRMPLRSGISPIAVGSKLLPRSVAQEPATFVQVHQRRTVKFLGKGWSENLQQPRSQLHAVNDHSVTVTHCWFELLATTTCVQERWCKTLCIHA
eukprot:CAMPEP_0194546596 /NCGR_PEP_ID=MMETSP0253-20130528/90901_1 /TAXON_ID=2966 /ORGANISM="Noctiluca scintillans" /LENGTH=97 /DNA_ID=CAMNT_0039393715 /DNA_START=214 /DNA_END=507 /DNA_ORIENTATION=+